MSARIGFRWEADGDWTQKGGDVSTRRDWSDGAGSDRVWTATGRLKSKDVLESRPSLVSILVLIQRDDFRLTGLQD